MGLRYIRGRRVRGWDPSEGSLVRGEGKCGEVGQWGECDPCTVRGEGAPSTPSERPLSEDALPRRQSLHPQTTLLLDHYTHKGETFS